MAIAVVFGVGGVVSNLVQKHEDKAAAEGERSEAKKERDKLTDQISRLITQQKVATEKADILQAQVNTLTQESIPKILGGVQNIPHTKETKPDLRLRLVYPTSVAVQICNELKAGVASSPKYQLTLADIDNIEADYLPVQTGDFIRPGECQGPNTALTLPAVKAVVKPGDRIFGYALVLCPHCVKTRSYWVYIEQGKGGWYEEMNTPLYPTGLNFYKDMKNDVLLC